MSQRGIEMKENLQKMEAHLVDIEEENGEVKLLQGLDFPLKMEDLIIAPNATNLDQIVDVINGGKSHPGSSSTFGTLIDTGKIGIVLHNGRVQAVGPGRWIFPNPRVTLKEVKTITDPTIFFESLSILRVQRGEIGLAKENGKYLLLGEGCHVRNSRLFEFDSFKALNQPYIQHGSLHIIRVPNGSYCFVTEAGVPKMLPEGIYVTDSNVFVNNGLQNINQPYLNHGTLHLLRIAKGKVGLVTDNNKPRLLGEGTHFINSSTFNYFGLQDLNQEVIRHGTITRFRVRKGEIGLAWENNNPAFFEEGVYEFDSPNFTYERCVNASDKQINLGSRKIVTVWDGEVGVSFKKGKLVILPPDRHIIEAMDHVFQGFLSTQQQYIPLLHGDSKDSLLFCETKDFVEIGLRADVFYKIQDAEKVLLVVGKDRVMPLVRDTSIATLNSIVRSTSLAEVAQNKEVAHKAVNPNSTGQFFDKVHDEFIFKLHDSFMAKFGIEITNIRIESFKITNVELANNISRQALTTANTENQLANLAGQTEIATAQQRRDADVNKIKADGDAVKLKTETDARNRATLETARAQADATVIKAKAEAESKTLRAEAEAKSILIKAEAEARRSQLLAATPLGGQMATFEIYSDMMKSSMTNVKKIVYLPTDVAKNPAALMSIQTTSGDGGMMMPFGMAVNQPQK
eukprot:TRINITY_DN55_c2_g1_i1.p1 TRINITY_DN55_c2_g1~~TRINITY_DN55_c2_g1_i1.p1  ORF type:complete len:685 (+),score=227.55 TRINITY_DN55_c2_g1_i1:51-2105(+)